MKMAKILLAASAVAVVGSSAPAFALNDTFATATTMNVNEPYRMGYYSSAVGYTMNQYFTARVIAGRSYCAETAVDPYNTLHGTDTYLYVYRGDTTTLITSNDDKSEPGGYAGGWTTSRACFIAPYTEAIYLITLNWMATGNYLQTRLVETTLFDPWWIRAAGSGYDAYAEIMNTTSNSLSFTLTARDSTGAPVGSSTVVLPANGGTVIAVSTLGGNGTGSWQIAHNGPPGAIAANSTSMSTTTGLSFDAVFNTRTPVGSN